MKKFALVTLEGTAIPETTLCEEHFKMEHHKYRASVLNADIKEIKSMVFEDVSENQFCICIVCPIFKRY